MIEQQAPDARSLSDQLDRLHKSPVLARCGSLLAFLRFVVEETLAGRGDSLKELVVGDALYGRHTPYDPRIDSTVRVEAIRLRQKLKTHYETVGRSDPVRIELPTGSYRPRFILAAQPVPAPADRLPASPAAGVDLAIMPFQTLSGTAADTRLADGVTDELIFALARSSRLRLAPRLAVFQFKGRRYRLPDAAGELGAAALLHGTCRREGDRHRVTVELIDPAGNVTWFDRVDERCDAAIGIAEGLAARIAARLPLARLFAIAANEEHSRLVH